MDHHHHRDQQHRSTAPLIAPQKLNISYLLNDPAADEKSESLTREAPSSRDLRSHRSRSIAGSSRRLHLPSSSMRDRISSVTPTLSSHGPTLFCPFCGESFQHVSLFEEHKRTHQTHAQSNQRTRSFTCEECGSKFSEKGNLNRHVKSVHKKEKPWLCEYCSSNFAFRDALNRHIDAVHLDLRPYSCTQCVAKFKKRAHLQRHMSTCHRSSTNPQ